MKVNKEYIEKLFTDIIDKNIFIKGTISRGCCKLVIDKLICAASLIFHKKIEIYFIDFC